MDNRDVAVKTIHKQIVTPHLTPEESLQVIKKVHTAVSCYVQQECVQASFKHLMALRVIC